MPKDVINVILMLILIALGTFAYNMFQITGRPTATLKNKKATVVCNVGFFYDTSKDFDWKTVLELEELTKQTCDPDDYEDRQTLEWRAPNGDPKHAVYIPADSVCVINWELHPVEHERAVRETCKPHDNQTLMEDGIYINSDGISPNH